MYLTSECIHSEIAKWGELKLYLLLLNAGKLKGNVDILVSRKLQKKTFEKAVAIANILKFVFNQKHKDNM